MIPFYIIFKRSNMNKSERINDMMLFLNDRSSFNLKDIMKKYNISRSTALRDISSLEEIGMPIYSQTGRNGHYRILPNKLLSPIVFNTDEIFSLYFSMLTLKAYETTPFHLSIEKLKEKFERCLPSDKIELIHKTEKVLSFGTVKQVNHCEFLKDILEFTLDEKICRIEYSKNNVIVSSPVGYPGRAVKTDLIKTLEPGTKKIQCISNCIFPCNRGEGARRVGYCIADSLGDAYLGRLQSGLFFSGANGYKLKEIVHVKELIDELMTNVK